jgi:hypothetical protein
MQLWKQWLVFSRRERRGVLWLIFLNLLFLIFPWAYSQLYFTPRIEHTVEENHYYHSTPIDSQGSSKSIVIEEQFQKPVEGKSSVENYSKPAQIIDLNQADSIAFLEVYGIGPVLAGRIIRFRDALGGFVSKEQLNDVYGISDEFLPEILKGVTVTNPAKPWVDVNTFSFKELLAHPYVSYEMAGQIIDLRYELNIIKGDEDMITGVISDTVLLSKLIPYLLYP